MPIYYADSSALIKQFVPERGSKWVSSLVESEQIVVSVLALPEVASALGRRSREGTLRADEARAIHSTFLRQALGFRVQDLTQGVLRAATQILLDGVGGVSLRTLDALHLATVQQSVILSGLGTDDLVVLTADRHLMVAASAAGLQVENPEDHA